jgi:hypothetical protein
LCCLHVGGVVAIDAESSAVLCDDLDYRGIDAAVVRARDGADHVVFAESARSALAHGVNARPVTAASTVKPM